MLRQGLRRLPTTIGRSNTSISRSILPKRALANSSLKINMDSPIEQTDGAVPACNMPSDVSAPLAESKELPKLTAQEFRIYNSMAEHMNYFVSREIPEPSWNRSTNISAARELQTNVEITIRSLLIRQTTFGGVYTCFSKHRRATLPPSHTPSHN